MKQIRVIFVLLLKQTGSNMVSYQEWYMSLICRIRVYLLQQNKDIYEESLRVAACGIPPIIQEEGGIVDRREFEASFRYAPFGFKFLSTATHFGCFPTALLLTIPDFLYAPDCLVGCFYFEFVIFRYMRCRLNLSW